MFLSEVSKSIFIWFKTVWSIFNSPNNDPIILGLLIALSAIIIQQISNFFSNRKLIIEKDIRIKDLITERDKLQDFLLNEQGHSRKSSLEKGNNIESQEEGD